MLLERRDTARYKVDPPSALTLDSIVNGTVTNASETGLGVVVPHKPALNSIVRVSVRLPDNGGSCEIRAQVMWSTSSGHIGLKLLQPASFRPHFEAWRAFTTQQVGLDGEAAQPQTNNDDSAAQLSSFDEVELLALRSAILADGETRKPLPLSRMAIAAAVIGCSLFGGSLWLWHARSVQGDTKVQASEQPPAEVAPAVMSVPANSELQAPHMAPGLSADAAGIQSTPQVARSDELTKPAAAPSQTEHHPAPSHTQIIVKLNRPARVNPKLLHNPERIYFDLSPGTRPELAQRSALTRHDRLVSRIRIGRAGNGYTRVVLDLRRPCHYRSEVSSTPPYKLTINIRAEKGRGTT